MPQGNVDQDSTQVSNNSNTAFTTSNTQIKYRTINQGSPINHSDVDANFEILRLAVNTIVSDISGVAGRTVGVDVPPNAVFTDTIYTLPIASDVVLGGIKVGTSLEMGTDANGDPDGVLDLSSTASISTSGHLSTANITTSTGFSFIESDIFIQNSSLDGIRITRDAASVAGITLSSNSQTTEAHFNFRGEVLIGPGDWTGDAVDGNGDSIKHDSVLSMYGIEGNTTSQAQDNRSWFLRASGEDAYFDILSGTTNTVSSEITAIGGGNLNRPTLRIGGTSAGNNVDLEVTGDLIVAGSGAGSSLERITSGYFALNTTHSVNKDPNRDIILNMGFRGGNGGNASVHAEFAYLTSMSSTAIPAQNGGDILVSAVINFQVYFSPTNQYYLTADTNSKLNFRCYESNLAGHYGVPSGKNFWVTAYYVS